MSFNIRKHSTVTTGLLIICVLIGLFQQSVFETLIYQRQAISNGQWWRLLTAHFIHINTAHLTLNISSLLIIHYLLSSRYDKHLLLFIVICCFFVSVCLFLFSSDIIWYAGLSAIIHGLFIVSSYLSNHIKIAVKSTIIAAVTLKTIAEQFFNSGWLSSELIDAAVIYDAHLYGVIVAYGYIVLIDRYRVIKARTKPMEGMSSN